MRLSSRRTVVLALASGFVIPSGLFWKSLPEARAADDNVNVSITPVPRRPSQQNSRSASIRVDVNLVLIPVMVTDLYDRPVRGLPKSEFHLFEDGVEREISQFYSDESPISIGIVFDASASMRRKMETSRAAIVEFLKMSTPGDEFFLLKFADRPDSVCDFTTETNDIEKSLPTIQAAGWTALYDGIYLGINRMKHASHERKVLLVLSDGGDNNSRFTESELRNVVKEADVRIFSISIVERSHVLETIAEETGGRAFHVRKLEELRELATNVSAELHSEYVLGFSPAERSRDGKYRKVKVEVAPETAGPRQLHTSWKRGYYSPVD